MVFVAPCRCDALRGCLLFLLCYWPILGAFALVSCFFVCSFLTPLLQSVGAELAPHKAHHDYYLMCSARFPLYSHSWAAQEELLLLEAVALCGLGNWSEISQHVQTKSADDCRLHFFAAYVDSPNYPTPIDPLSEEEIRAAWPMPVAVPIVEKKVIPKPGLSLPMKNNLGTFMPLRNEFDTPFNEEAEEIPADIVFNEDDNEEEKKTKVHALQIYASMLSERKKKTQFLVDLDLLDWKQHQLFDRSLSNDDAKLVSSMRPFLQCFATKSNWEKLVNGMLAEQHLRREISHYKSLREQGIKWMADASKLNSAFNKSNSSKRLKSSASSGNLVSGDSGRHNLRSSGTVSSGKLASGNTAPEVLSVSEIEYCDAFGIGGDLYLQIKEFFIRESCRGGGLNKKDARLLSPLPKHQSDQLYDFFLSCSWITPDRGGANTNANASARLRLMAPTVAVVTKTGTGSSGVSGIYFSKSEPLPEVPHSHTAVKNYLAQQVPPQL